MNALPMIADKDRRRVVAAAALMSSDKDGEALAAVRATCRLLEPHGVGPADVFRAAFDPPRVKVPLPACSFRSSSAHHSRTVRMCLMMAEHLNDWEREFLNSILHVRSLTEKQAAKLRGIEEKIDRAVQS